MNNMMKTIFPITRKELEGYFGSPLAIIFLGTFLAVVLFIFFSVERFFARGIADVRPLFQWMPILLIFLLAALTMRQWSEEQRTGTMELLLTLPVDLIRLVLGKFLAVMILIAIALALTLPLPVTVSLIGRLDWGPVLGGYLAALLMAAAYAAIGLFISSRTDNQIVALISTILLGGLFYLVGTRGVTDFFGGSVSQVLWAFGTGSRFESIERGVIDLRDLVYYISLTGIFLLLNTVSLDSLRWSQKQTQYLRIFLFTAGLIIVNLALVNVWFFPLQGLRVDLTAQKEYTISQTTKGLLNNLQEPLVIRAYLSEKTHPLLAPLTPAISDMLREYEIAGKGKVTAEVVDPIKDSQIEAEANQTYGIRPTPFRVSGRHESSILNSYFDILVRYGDQTMVLGLSDLVEIQERADGMDVSLRNLEYDLTRAIKKAVFGFQSVDSVLAALEKPVELTLYETSSLLPPQLKSTEEVIRKVVSEIQAVSQGKMVFNVVNPDAPDSKVNRQVLAEIYGIQPIPVSIFSNDTFYLHMVLKNGDKTELIYPYEEMTEAEVRTEIESALKRTSTGFLKVVGLWTPPETPTQDMFGQMQQPLSTYQQIRQQLGQEYSLKSVDLSTGAIPEDIDVLVVEAPRDLNDKALFAIDQYLMRGGSVVIATSAYRVDADPYQGLLALMPVENGVADLLKSYGIELGKSVVMDNQNDAFPVTVPRQVGDFQVQEIQAVRYPFFVDIRPNGMSSDSPIVANLQAVTMQWVSPITLDKDKNVIRDTKILLKSSPKSWLSSDTNIQPNFNQYPQLGFPGPETTGKTQAGEGTAPYILGVSIRGSFASFFKPGVPGNKPSPFEAGGISPAENVQGPSAPGQEPTQEAAKVVGTIEKSPETTRLVVIGSSSFVDDFVLGLSSRLSQDRYLNNLRFLQNAVDWSVEDLDLLTIRSRGTATRVLAPMDDRQQTVWEVLNYTMALAALLGIYFYWRYRKQNENPLELLPIKTTEQETGRKLS